MRLLKSLLTALLITLLGWFAPLFLLVHDPIQVWFRNPEGFVIFMAFTVTGLLLLFPIEIFLVLILFPRRCKKLL